MTFLTQAALMTPTQRLQRAHVELMSHDHTKPYAGVLMVGKYKVLPEVRTARTNGIDCDYGEKFITQQPDAELRGLILHENLHKTFQHMFLWKHLYEQNPRVANMACDYVINLIIADLDRDTNGFVKLPQGGLLDQKFRGMSSQDVFDKLMEDGQGNSGQGDEGGGLDDHDWTSGDQMSQEDIEQVTREIDQAIRQGQMMAGKLGGKQSRALDELLEPKVDWREQLREFVSSTSSGKDMSTWQRVNRRWLQHDMYLPSTISETLGRIVVAVDTSGSIGGRELTEFLSEVQAIAANTQPEKIDLLYWDTEVARHEVYAQDQLDKLIDSTKPAGGGGTYVECVPKYMQDNQIKPECVIVLTDGYLGGSWGQWSVPVLWCIAHNKSAKPSTGVAIHID